MSGVNRWQGIINIGADPELKFTQGGQAVLNWSGACNEKYTTNGQEKEIVTWLRFVVWSKRAEALAKHIKKGDRLFVEGPLRIDEYTDRDGNKRKQVQVVVQGLEFMGGGGKGREGGAPGGQSSGGKPAQGPQQGSVPEPDYGGHGGGDDDIPF